MTQDSTTDVLVVGGGIMGCATAYSLARRGIHVTLVERNAAPGRETTGRSGAIIRAHYGVPELVTLALAANRKYAHFEEEVGEDCGFTPCGYSVLVDADDVETLTANVAMHRDLGVNVSLLAPAALGERVPGLKTEDAALVAWEPEGGFANPAMTVAAYADRARAFGASLRFQAPVVAASPAGSGWNVSLGNGDVLSAGQVVLCTGNWSCPVGGLFGIDLPVTPVRAQIVVLERPESVPADFPVISDLIHLAYYRADDTGIWVGSSDMADLRESLPQPEGFDEVAGEAALSEARRKAALRWEGVHSTDAAIQRSFCGLYETTPDWQPILDQFGANLHVAVGFSGHGFKLAPVVGEIMAAQATGDTPPFDISLFALRRFAEGRPIKSRHTYQRARFLR